MESILRRARLLLGPFNGLFGARHSTLAGTKIGSRLAASTPLQLIVWGSIYWGAMMALSALGALCLRNALLTDHATVLLSLYFLGGLLAWAPALWSARHVARGRPTETRLAAYLLALSLGTVAATAILFALQYREFYARWHAPFGSVAWAFQFAFTGASAAYQFAVLGIRLFLPLGLPILLATSFYLARRSAK